jgi:CheY-like chemotaxis protein
VDGHLSYPNIDLEVDYLLTNLSIRAAWLPGMDGYEVARKLRALPEFEGVTMCALTGYAPSEADRDRPRQAGFDHHFIKPLNLNTLLELLGTVH